jgi:hypothetical protein
VLCSKQAKQDPWLVKLLETKERKAAACALANKMARIGWAVMMRQEDFRSRRHDQPGPTWASVTPCSPPSRPLRARLRRWPAASLDRSCARRLVGARSGRRNGLLIEQRNRI